MFESTAVNLVSFQDSNS